MELDKLPIMAIVGRSGAGKTTLIVELLSRLKQRNLKIAVVKYAGKQVSIDRAGKDSDLFFLNGADVYLQAKAELFYRFHTILDHAPSSEIEMRLCQIARNYDLVLVEGCKQKLSTSVLLLRADEEASAVDRQGATLLLGPDERRPDAVMDLIDQWLPQQWQKMPVYGCVLIGGNSSRMGQAKHLLKKDGQTWLAYAVATLRQKTDAVVVAGQGDIPPGLDVPRLVDPPDVKGPLAGIVAAMRWYPWASWVIVACDLPHMSAEALDWLLAERKPGVWAVLPQVSQGGVEPLLAYYDYRIQTEIERMVSLRQWRAGRLKEHLKTVVVNPPQDLCGSWRNVNTPQELLSALRYASDTRHRFTVSLLCDRSCNE